MYKLYEDDEWIPETNDKNWNKIETDFYQYTIKNQPTIIYSIDSKLKVAVKKIMELEKKITKPIDYNIHNDYKIAKVYRIFDDKTSFICYTTLTVQQSIKMTYEKYLLSEESHFNYFRDVKKVKIELLECYKSKKLPRITMNEIKNRLTKKYTKNILNIYLEIVEKIYQKKNKIYYIYNLVGKTKNFIFYTQKKINSTNQKEILENNFHQQKIKPFNGKIELLEEIKLYNNIHAQLLIESYLYNKIIEYVNKYIIYDPDILPNQLIKIKRRIEGFIKMEEIDKYLNDYTVEEYKDILGICFSIKVNNKYFVDITINKTVTEIIKGLYSNNIPTKYKKLSKEIKKVDFKKDVDVNFEYVAEDDNGKEQLVKTKRQLVRKYKVYDKELGLNQKPFNIYKKSFYSK